MNSVISTARIVAHALAVWNSYAGTLTQEDKDFFDTCASDLDARLGEMTAVEHCIAERLQNNGYADSRAREMAAGLVETYAEQWGRVMAPLARA